MSYYYDGISYSYDEIKKRIEDELKNNIKNPDERSSLTLELVEGEKILDVGCAAGNLSKKLADKGFFVYAIDVLEESIKIAKEFFNSSKITYEVRDILKEPFEEKSFDCITFLETIEHVENPAMFFREFHRILRDNGHLIISTPNSTSLKNMLYALSYRKKEKRESIINEIATEQKHTGTQLEHIYNWDFPVLVRLLDMCGFKIVDHKFTGSGPIVISIFGKKIQLIKRKSKIFRGFEPLMTTHVIKAQKKD